MTPPESQPDLPDDLRAEGWAVAVHNDYRQGGSSRTFWLLTRGEECVKGEGHSDAIALTEIRATLRRRRATRSYYVLAGRLEAMSRCANINATPETQADLVALAGALRRLEAPSPDCDTGFCGNGFHIHDCASRSNGTGIGTPEEHERLALAETLSNHATKLAATRDVPYPDRTISLLYQASGSLVESVPPAIVPRR